MIQLINVLNNKPTPNHSTKTVNDNNKYNSINYNNNNSNNDNNNNNNINTEKLYKKLTFS